MLSTNFATKSLAKPLLAGNKYELILDQFLSFKEQISDFDRILQSGYLRIIHTQKKIDPYELDLLNHFAKINKLTPLFIKKSSSLTNKRLIENDLVDILMTNEDKSKQLTPIEDQVHVPLSWQIPNSKSQLKTALAKYLENYLASKQAQHKDKPLKAPQALRVVTQLDETDYFLKKGVPAGFQFELLKRFAKQQKRWLEITVVNSETEMLEHLNNGKADLATLVSTHLINENTSLSLPILPADDFVIAPRTNRHFQGADEIDLVSLLVQDPKKQQASIKKLKKNGHRIATINLSESLSYEEFLHTVIEKDYSLALVPARSYMLAKQQHHQLKVITDENRQNLHHWAVNKSNPTLITAIDDFISKEYQGEFFNVLYKRYYASNKKPSIFPRQISPYDKLIKKYAESYHFDWRLVVAQIYQESHFNARALSSSGAQGLMQIMPKTAKQLRISKVYHPESSIKAGLRYMRILRNQYKNDLPEDEKNWFTLASYNAGFERIEDARKFASTLGYNKDRWFGHVELAMQLLADPKNKEHTRFGFCRCGQTVDYVRKIRQLYISYRHFTEPPLFDKAIARY